MNKILKPGFAHVRVVVHLQYVDIYVDPRIAYTQVNCYPRGEAPLADADEVAVTVDSFVDIHKMRRFFGPLNCVEVVKGHIGMSKPLIFTPYQLYKEVNHGRSTEGSR